MNKRVLLVTVVLVTLIIGIFFFSLQLGTFAMTPIETLQTLFGQGTREQGIALFTMRMPRIFLAILVGGALATAGTILQGITRNDLAEPGILGISSGASMAVVLFIFLMDGGVYYRLGISTIYTMPFVAFLGGACSAFLIYRLAWKQKLSTTRLLLIGIGMNAALTAMIIMFQIRFSTEDFNRILVWTSGSLFGTSWDYVLAVAPWIVILLGITLYKARYLDILLLGESIPIGLGVRLEKERFFMIVLVVALTGMATAVAGSIGFLGLLSPHIARVLVGPKHRVLLPTAMLVGIFILLTSDTIARNLLDAVELPVGIVVAIVGVPYFLYLLTKSDRK